MFYKYVYSIILSIFCFGMQAQNISEANNTIGLAYIPNHSITSYYVAYKLPGICLTTSTEFSRLGLGTMFSELIKIKNNVDINIQALFLITNFDVKQQLGVNMIVQAGVRYKHFIYHISLALPDNDFKDFNIGIGIAFTY